MMDESLIYLASLPEKAVSAREMVSRTLMVPAWAAPKSCLRTGPTPSFLANIHVSGGSYGLVSFSES